MTTKATKTETIPPKPALEVYTLSEVRRQLDDRREQLLALLGPSIPLDRFLTVALHAVNSNHDLLACEPLSIVEAIREAAALRLEPTGLLGDAYLVKYGTQARLMPGYRGLMKLARRSGVIDAIDAQVVYEGDAFEVDLGTAPVIIHRPALADRGNYRGAYAWARFHDTGELIVEWMSFADIETVRKSSRASDKGPWVSAWGEMARKTALRRLMKRLPLATEADRALELEAEAEQAAAAEGTRQPSPAIRQIHSRLGLGQPETTFRSQPLPQTIEVVDEKGYTATVEIVDPPSDAVVAAFDGLIAQADENGDVKASLLCGDPSPLTEGAVCILPVGHKGVHRIGDTESWPRR